VLGPDGRAQSRAFNEQGDKPLPIGALYLGKANKNYIWKFRDPSYFNLYENNEPVHSHWLFWQNKAQNSNLSSHNKAFVGYSKLSNFANTV
jgi:hypothetical protein